LPQCVEESLYNRERGALRAFSRMQQAVFYKA
jgi:hypothetical protein